MYDSACEQCKLHDAGREAGATQVAATLELEKTCAYEENNGSRVKIEKWRKQTWE